MSFNSYAQIANAIETDGKFHYAYLHKATIPVSGTAGFFIDLNQSAGIPKYNAFVGSALESTVLTGSGNNGIYPGNFITGSTKHLLRWQHYSNASAPNIHYLLDYLMFYPLIDCDDDSGPQDFTNLVGLSRYTDGAGVRAILVATAPMTATASCTVSYTNQDGISGRTSTFNLIPAASIGVCATGTGAAGGAGQVNPFIPLTGGDIGMRSVESLTMLGAAGGFVTLALVKPIAQLTDYETGTTSEVQYGFDTRVMPEIKPGAYLNLLIGRGGTVTQYLRDEFIFINS